MRLTRRRTTLLISAIIIPAVLHGPAYAADHTTLASLLSAQSSALITSSAPFTYHYTEILGTSCDISIIAPDQPTADAAEKAALAEIERLRRILSIYDPAAELAKLNAAPAPTAPTPASPELLEVLSHYDRWQATTKGAYSGHLGQLVALYKKAQSDNRLPATADFATVVAGLAQPAWKIDPVARTVQRLTAQAINVDSLGKGYIVGKAIDAARAHAPTLAGILINIGGDIHTWGSASLTEKTPWSIGVADPLHHADNAAPATTILLRDQAVATSAAYERFYTIGGKKYSHILDPRTGETADTTARLLSATVIAPDCPTANALATSLCILGADDGLELIRSTPGAECFLITADGQQLRSDGFPAFESQTTADTSGTATTQPATQPASLWPANYGVNVNINLSQSRRRPYVCCWVADDNGNHIKTLAVWGNNPKYLRDMRAWWKICTADPTLKTVTRATRPSGKYTLAWDGTDQAGQPVKPGTYTVFLEVCIEKGPYALKSGTIACAKDPATGKIEPTTAFAETLIEYGPPQTP